MDTSVKSQILLYKSSDGEIKLDAFIQNQTIWLSQKQISSLFGVEIPTINEHLRNIFQTRELSKDSVIRKFRITAEDGKKYLTNFYNLDVIISVGYKVNSIKATRFRIWATKVLREYIIKGFVMDDERLKDPYRVFGQDYFEEQLERIRNIRSSERRFYQKITDIYSQCSIDYDSNSIITKEFFSTVQNKLHFAISGKTASEIILTRINSTKKNLGLTTWKYSPKGIIRKNDIEIAKNYLNQEELSSLNRIVSMYLDYAEDQAKRKNAMTMQDWINKLNSFLKFNERDILKNAGKISHELAIEFAHKEFEKYSRKQDRLFKSDFDKLVANTRKILKK